MMYPGMYVTGDSGEIFEQAPKKKKKKQFVLNRDMVIKRLNRQKGPAKESPLVQLQEIFEEAEDKGRFVGDTMFWKYFPDIAIERIYHTDSVEYRNLKVMFWETVFYCVLLILFTTYVYIFQSRDVFAARAEQELYWAGCNSSNVCKIHEINSLASFWDFMHGEFVDRAFTEYADPPPNVATLLTSYSTNDFPIKWHPRFVGPRKGTVLLGRVRMRQLRVEKNSGCAVSKLYSHIYPDCYGMYKPSVASKTPYASRFVPTYIREGFTYQTAEDTLQAPMQGNLAAYGGDGFLVDLPWNASDCRTMIGDLREWMWVDRATRGVVVELSTLHTNANVIVNSRLLFEFGPTGSVTGVVRSLGGSVALFTPATSTPAASSMLGMMIVLIILFLLFAGYCGWLMYKTCRNFIGENPIKYMRRQNMYGKVSFIFKTFFAYLRTLWNLADLVMIGLFFAHIGYRFTTYSAVSGSPSMAPDVIGHPEVFVPFSGIMRPLVTSNQILSMLAALMWFKLFKYLCMSSYFHVLVRILEICAFRLFVFAVLIVCIIFGFAVAFFAGWGCVEESYSWIEGAFLVNFFLLIDGFTINDEWFLPGKDFIMPMIFFIYIAVLYFVLINIAVAIVLDIYATVDRSLKDDPNRKNPMAVFLYTYYKMMLGMSLVRDTEEENMKSEDLSIPLQMLPGVVRRKWIEKKRRLQRIANESFAGMDIYPKELDAGSRGMQGSAEWMLPNSRQDVFESMDAGSDGRPLALYDVPEALLKAEISRAQLQRLMDEDPALPILLQESRAEMVIRRFKNLDRDGSEGGDGPSTVKRLQGQVFGKIDEMEKVKLDDEIKEVDEITELTHEMSDAITSVRNKFRIQLTEIIEATAILFEHLVAVTQGLDAVRENNDLVLEWARNAEEEEINRGQERARFRK